MQLGAKPIPEAITDYHSEKNSRDNEEGIKESELREKRHHEKRCIALDEHKKKYQQVSQ